MASWGQNKSSRWLLRPLFSFCERIVEGQNLFPPKTFSPPPAPATMTNLSSYNRTDGFYSVNRVSVRRDPRRGVVVDRAGRLPKTPVYVSVQPWLRPWRDHTAAIIHVRSIAFRSWNVPEIRSMSRPSLTLYSLIV